MHPLYRRKRLRCADKCASVSPIIEPLAMLTVTSATDLSPCAALIFLSRSCCAGMAAASTSLM
jgi:hypothetical protein